MDNDFEAWLYYERQSAAVESFRYKNFPLDDVNGYTKLIFANFNTFQQFHAHYKLDVFDKTVSREESQQFLEEMYLETKSNNSILITDEMGNDI